MKLIRRITAKTIAYAGSPRAVWYLIATSFAESSFFPIPAYFLLAPMALARPDRAINYGILAALASVAGGMLGYFLGCMLFAPVVMPLLKLVGQLQNFELILERFSDYSFWGVLAAGFLPIPYKVITIGAGFMKLPFWSFLAASLISRTSKFLIISISLRLGVRTLRPV